MNIKEQKKEKISKYRLFVILIIVVKIILMMSFSSDYQDKLFMPFVNDFISNLHNSYQIFGENGVTNAFPYPIVMLLTQSIGEVLISVFHVSFLPVQNLLFKLPSLAMDILILFYLSKLFPEKRRYVAVLYFSSPIILYAVYMHGQLDLIPTGFLIISIYYLVAGREKQSLVKSGIFLTLALLSKLHILAALPIILLYLLKREGLKKTFYYGGGVTAFTVLGLLPFWSEGFSQMVLFNSEQAVLTQVYVRFASICIYIPIIAVLLIYLSTFNISVINKNLLISLLGVLFAVFLALCPPMPGWYVWIVPFITVFFIQVNENKYRNIGIYALLNAIYLIYFGVFHNKGMVDLYFYGMDLSSMKINSSVWKNMMFTLLAGVLLYIIYSMYQLGVASNAFYKRRNLPFTISIAGDSGSGKSTLIEIVKKCLGEHNLLFIEGDGDHKWERGEKEWEDYTHLNPKANYLYRQAADIEQLRSGAAIRRMEYDHTSGTFSEAHKIKPNRFIMLCGLHSMYLPQMRRNTDLKIYMDTDEELRRFWKIKRDVKERGYSKQSILEQILARVPDAQKYILPQKKYADLVIEYFDKNLKNCMMDDYEEKLSLKLTLSSDVNVEPVIAELSKYNINVIYDYSDDLKQQILIFEGETLQKKDIPFEKIAENAVVQLEEITNQNLNEWNTMNGIVELFLLLLISYKMQDY